MQTDWKIDVAMVDSTGDPLHNVMYFIWDRLGYGMEYSMLHRPKKELTVS